MENISFNLAQLHQYGTAFYDYLGLRKRFFVDSLGWDIPHDDDVEMDQYDNPKAHYSLVLRDGKVIGGARAMSTTAIWGSHTYMLRDAVNGKLIDIPANIIAEAAATPELWECTRLVISDDVTTQADRGLCLSLIVDGLINMATEQGATQLMALSRPSLARALRQLGYGANLIGAPYYNPGDGRKYAVMSMPANRKRPHVPHATHIPKQQAVHAPSVI